MHIGLVLQIVAHAADHPEMHAEERGEGDILDALAGREPPPPPSHEAALQRLEALSLLSCANLACSNLQSASEGEARGKRCSGCRAAS